MARNRPIAGQRTRAHLGVSSPTERRTVAADGGKDRHAVSDESAPALWARFYELGTNKPIYVGRDKVIRYDFNGIERERRIGYNYLGEWPAKLILQDYPRWRERNHLP